MTTPERPETHADATETPLLGSFLTYVRAVTKAKCEDLSDEAASSPHEPSGLSVLGVVQHLTQVERWWYGRVFLGLDVAFPWSDEDPDAEFRVAPGTTVASVLAAYDEACAVSDGMLAEHRLDEVASFQPAYRPAPTTLRWIAVHLIEETSRHNGHLDLIREAIDGRTGEF